MLKIGDKVITKYQQIGTIFAFRDNNPRPSRSVLILDELNPNLYLEATERELLNITDKAYILPADSATTEGPEVDILRAADHGHMTMNEAIAALEGISYCRSQGRG